MDHEGAKTFVNELKDEFIRRQITPKKIVQILMNIDETGIMYNRSDHGGVTRYNRL